MMIVRKVNYIKDMNGKKGKKKARDCLRFPNSAGGFSLAAG
jgi:hypothetical protein